MTHIMFEIFCVSAMFETPCVPAMYDAIQVLLSLYVDFNFNLNRVLITFDIFKHSWILFKQSLYSSGD